MSPLANEIHSWVNTGGIGTGVVVGLRVAGYIGKTVEKLDRHIENTRELFDAMHRRVEWLERHRQ